MLFRGPRLLLCGPNYTALSYCIMCNKIAGSDKQDWENVTETEKAKGNYQMPGKGVLQHSICYNIFNPSAKTIETL